MLILMEHEKHGRMHVYSNTEMEQAKLNGWTVVPEYVAKPVPAVDVVAPEPPHSHAIAHEKHRDKK